MLQPDLNRFTHIASGRLAGLDHGSKTIGVAISDAWWQLAAPVTTIRRGKLVRDIAQLQTLIGEHGIGGIVIGYPLNMDGTAGPRCQSVRAFVRHLEAHCDLPLLLWDERLSSAAAEEAMKAAGRRAARRHATRDAAAAAVILQGMLDGLATNC